MVIHNHHAILILVGELLAVILTCKRMQEGYNSLNIGISSLAFIVPFLGWIVGGIAYIIVAVLEIIGIVRCLQGKMIPLPIVGKYTVLK